MVVGWEVPPSGTIADGLWAVGTDIQPGRYRTAGPSGEWSCKWRRLDSPNDANAIVAPFFDGSSGYVDGPTYVEILAADKFFLSEDCEVWVKVE